MPDSDFASRFREAPCSGDTVATFARSVVAGLADNPRWLHCRFLYDAEGSRLFERITEQPEYYPTRTEASILERHAKEIRAITGPVTLVELGSGYSVKTEHLLSAYSRQGGDTDYVPIDVSVSALREANRSISDSFPEVNFTGISGTYASAFPMFRQLSPQMVVFLGSTLGNFSDAEHDAFWTSIARHLPEGDYFLLGVDLVKDPVILEAAYNDAAGMTACFTTNYFTRMNRELGSSIDTDQVEHVAVWSPERQRMEISTRFNAPQNIHVQPLGEVFEIGRGEQVLMEISRKFRLPELITDLNRFGFRVRRVFTDEREWFGLLLLERAGEPAPE
jgi:L-histidine N-alpha-methyltransferase